MISIVVVTPDKMISQTIGLQKSSLIPGDIRERYKNLSIVSYPIETSTTLQHLADYFVKTPRHVTGIIVLCDNRCAYFARHLDTPLFTIIIDHALNGKNLHNYLGMVLSKVIRAFVVFADRFDKEQYRKLLILPLRNFLAEEIAELHALFRHGVNPDGNFYNSLDRILKSLRDRQMPKVQSSSRRTYIADSQDRFFEYGKEKHCPLETSVPPHSHLCAVTGIFRFGKRYDPDRHFNVSLGGENEKISGIFVDCHDERAERKPRSHLNMFPNDFFGTN